MLGIGITYDQNKTEAVWLGSNAAPLLNLETKEEIKLLGLTIINTKCAEHNWEKGTGNYIRNQNLENI